MDEYPVLLIKSGFQMAKVWQSLGGFGSKNFQSESRQMSNSTFSVTSNFNPQISPPKKIKFPKGHIFQQQKSCFQRNLVV